MSDIIVAILAFWFAMTSAWAVSCPRSAVTSSRIVVNAARISSTVVI